MCVIQSEDQAYEGLLLTFRRYAARHGDRTMVAKLDEAMLYRGKHVEDGADGSILIRTVEPKKRPEFFDWCGC